MIAARVTFARWWDIYALPIAAAVGIFCLAGLLFVAWLRVLP